MLQMTKGQELFAMLASWYLGTPFEVECVKLLAKGRDCSDWEDVAEDLLKAFAKAVQKHKPERN